MLPTVLIDCTLMPSEVTDSLSDMHERVLDAERTGDWESLRAKAEVI